MENNIMLREATLLDADMLLSWKNDVDVRKASHSSEIVTMEEHMSWLSSVLGSPERILLIAEENKISVGSVRADLSRGVWELHWSVSPGARGHSVAKRMVSTLAEKISDPIRAEVKVDNIASIKVAEHAGMTLSGRVQGVLHYYRGVGK